ncbi:IS3 family transposase [Hydrogeniiclostridium mannosilyticum]|uniref:IS3 family transposase n=1 Tax=Hydrogeniiclostridium mannosilyticum TaxID=2764322 RepID=UPI00399B5DE9
MTHCIGHTQEEFKASIAEYIEFYNEGRSHRKLHMKTPAQFEAKYFSAVNTK